MRRSGADAQPFIVAEGIFAQMPVRAAMFQSGRLRVANASEIVSFSQPFPSKPKVSVWVVGALGVIKLPNENVVATNSCAYNVVYCVNCQGITITLHPSNFAEYKGMAFNWMAFVLPSTNPLLAETLSLITSHTKLTQPLQDKVEQAIKVFSY